MSADVTNDNSTGDANSSSRNGQQHCHGKLNCLPTEQLVLFSVAFSVIILIGIFGNIFVITIVLASKKMKKAPINCLLVNLAFADLGNLVVIVPDIAQALFDRGWVLPWWMCPITRYSEEMFLFSSLLLQGLICVERYLAICKPFRQWRLSRQSAFFTAVVCWSLGAAFALPYGFFHKTIEYHHHYICFWNDMFKTKLRLWFKLGECLLLYVLPLVLFTVLYTRTAALLWGKQEVQDLHGSAAMAEHLLKMRRSVVKMLIICLAVYFFCYSPIQTLFICETLLSIRVYIPMWMRWTLNGLTLANSAANPIVYIFCCRHFREKFVATLRRVPILRGWLPADKYIAEDFAQPMRANKAIRTHLAMAMRMATPDTRQEAARALVAELSSVTQRQTQMQQTRSRSGMPGNAPELVSTGLREFGRIQELRRKQAYAECIVDL